MLLVIHIFSLFIRFLLFLITSQTVFKTLFTYTFAHIHTLHVPFNLQRRRSAELIESPHVDTNPRLLSLYTMQPTHDPNKDNIKITLSTMSSSS